MKVLAITLSLSVIKKSNLSNCIRLYPCASACKMASFRFCLLFPDSNISSEPIKITQSGDWTSAMSYNFLKIGFHRKVLDSNCSIFNIPCPKNFLHIFNVLSVEPLSNTTRLIPCKIWCSITSDIISSSLYTASIPTIFNIQN